MGMYQVLLVDDEPAVTDSLCYGIDWEALGLRVAAVVQNGNQALTVIEKQPVDIVVTDIRMADLDGLSLSKKISQMKKNIQVILLSGFAEFSYAQKALSYGVIGYCLKPVEYEELSRYLKQAVQNLNSASHGREYGSHLLDSLYSGNVREAKVCLAQAGLYGSSYYLAVSVSKYPFPVQEKQSVMVQLGRWAFGYISMHPYSRKQIEAHMEETHCRGSSYFPKPVRTQQICSVLLHLNDAAYGFFFCPDKKIVVDDVTPRANPEMRKLKKVLEEGSRKELLCFLDSLEKSGSGGMSLKNAWQLYNMLAVHDKYGSAIATDDIYSPEHLIYQYGTFGNMIEVLKDRIEESRNQDGFEDLSNTTFLQMLEYIDGHLHEDCSLKRLGKAMNMNANYLGQIFKRETGKNYTAYITQLRIEKAKEMLDAGEHSIEEIATTLGFNDYFYFLKTFKRITGYTPKQYGQGAEGKVPLFAVKT